MKIADIRSRCDALLLEGIEPLDLLSWVFLLDLHARYKEFTGLDLDVHYRMKDGVAGALWRKARMLDEEKGTSWHADLLREMGVVEPASKPA